jgi:hypothetical protein
MFREYSPRNLILMFTKFQSYKTCFWLSLRTNKLECLSTRATRDTFSPSLILWVGQEES